MARGAAARGKRIAFGDGHQIIWDQHSEEIFKGNPNIARPGDDRAPDIEWVAHYKGHRLYNTHDVANNRWLWNYDFRAIPGEIFFTDDERRFGKVAGKGFVVVEPHVPSFKGCAPNKTWPLERYAAVVLKLRRLGVDVLQFIGQKYGGPTLTGVKAVKAPSFRSALAVLSHAALYVGPEGGLHHGAAAVDVPAVVLFGGFIPPAVTGYDAHVNLTGGAEACGSLSRCEHCAAAMAAIEIKHVLHEVKGLLGKGAAPV